MPVFSDVTIAAAAAANLEDAQVNAASLLASMTTTVSPSFSIGDESYQLTDEKRALLEILKETRNMAFEDEAPFEVINETF